MEMLTTLIESGFLGLFSAIVPCIVMFSILNGTERSLKMKN